MNVKENTELVFREVAEASLNAHRESGSVSVIAVTKYVDVPTAEALLPLGVHHIGENRVDKFLEKYEALKDRDVTWHLIGTLQRRKVKDVIQFVDYFHALDSVKLAEEIQKRSDRVIKCFLQVNISKEESKHGLYEEDVVNFIKDVSDKYENIHIRGLMTMAPFTEDENKVRDVFKKLKNLSLEIDSLNIKNVSMDYISMGMSNDYNIAIEEGSNIVRVGTSIFGKRNYN